MSYEAWKNGYKSLWEQMNVTKVNEASKQARHIIGVRGQYEVVEKATGVPWFIIGICHVREAGDPPDFKAVLHNGERIVGTGKKTRLVPKNRGPFRSWPEAAVDAVNIEHLNGVNWNDGWGPEHVAFFLEVFNGTGYRGHGIPSPYLWGGTSVQKRGKYTSDSHYDPDTMDPQVGGMAILKELMALDPSVSFSEAPKAGFPKTIPPNNHLAPKTLSSELPPGVKPSLPSLPVPDPKGPQRKHGIFAALAAVGIWFHEHWPLLLAGAIVAGAGYGLYKWWQHRAPRNLSPKAEGPTGPLAELVPTTEPAPVETPATPNVSEPKVDTPPPVSGETPPSG